MAIFTGNKGNLMTKRKNIILGIILCSGALFLSGCSNAPVAKNQAGTVSKESIVTVKQGKITQIEHVTIQATSGRGSEADRQLSNQKGYEITLELTTGESVIVTQLADTEFEVGDSVQLLIEDNKARVLHLQDNS